MRIGIIGCGVVGAYLAWKLAKEHEVFVFEERKKIGGKPCSGLISERLWEFIPKNRRIVKHKIRCCNINFPKKTTTLYFSPRMMVIDRSGLDRYIAGLAQKAGAKIYRGYKAKRIFFRRRSRPQVSFENKKRSRVFEFDRIIGADGALSFVRKEMGVKEPNFRLGIYAYKRQKSKKRTVETFPLRNGFSWKIPRKDNMEIGIIEESVRAKKGFERVRKRFKVPKKARKYSALIPSGVVTTNMRKVALCGDAAGLAKPWSISKDEAVLIKENGLIKNKRIEEIKKSNGLSAFSISNDKSIDFYNVEKVLNHRLKEELFEITLGRGYSIQTTKSHSVITISGDKFVEKRVSDLKEGTDYLLISVNVPSNDCISEINIKEKLIHSRDKIQIKEKGRKISYKPSGGLWLPSKVKITPELCRLLGYYVADGSGSKGVSIALGESDVYKGYDKDIQYCVKKVFGIKTSKLMRPNRRNRPNTKEYALEFGGKLLTELFVNGLEIGKGAKNKQIPYIIFNINKKLQLEFLKGYLRGDGHARVRLGKKRRNWSADMFVKTASRKLASDLVILSLQIGLFPSVEKSKSREHTSYGKKIKTKEAYKILFSRRKDLKILKDMFDDDKNLRRYLSVDKSGKSDFYLPKFLIDKDLIRRLPYGRLRNYFINRLNTRRAKAVSYEEVKELISKFHNREDLKFLNKLIKNGIILLPVKKIRKIKYSAKVYDLSVPETNTFSGGVGTILLHNSGGGVVWGLTAADMLVDAFPDVRRYNRRVRRKFVPKLMMGNIMNKAVIFTGNHMSWFLPKEVVFDPDWGV